MPSSSAHQFDVVDDDVGGGADPEPAFAPTAALSEPGRWAGTRSLVFWTPYFQGSTICMAVLDACALPTPGVTPSVRT
jgi:hypothetical protein